MESKTDISIQPWSFSDYDDYRDEWNARIEELGADEWEAVDYTAVARTR